MNLKKVKRIYPIFRCVLFGADFAEEVEAFAFGVVVLGVAFFASFFSVIAGSSSLATSALTKLSGVIYPAL